MYSNHINIQQIFHSIGRQRRPEINISNECVQVSASPLKGHFEPIDIKAEIKPEDAEFIVDVNRNVGIDPIRLKLKPEVEPSAQSTDNIPTNSMPTLSAENMEQTNDNQA